MLRDPISRGDTEEVGMHVLNPQYGAPPRDVRVFNVGTGSLLDEQHVLLFDEPEGLKCGWYGFLMHGLAPRVQMVEVYATRFGRCGVFRRGPLTGRWHTTSEEAHRWGSAVALKACDSTSGTPKPKALIAEPGQPAAPIAFGMQTQCSSSDYFRVGSFRPAAVTRRRPTPNGRKDEQ